MGKRVFFANPPTGNVQDLSDKGIIVFENLINDLILEKDTSAPTITIKGNNPFTVMQNGQYSDAGVEVVDNRDPKPKLLSLHPIRSTLEYPPVCVRVPSNRMDKTTPNPGNLGIEALGPGDSEKGSLQGGSHGPTTQPLSTPGKSMTKTGVCPSTKTLTTKHGSE